jgi:hypothetical protein
MGKAKELLLLAWITYHDGCVWLRRAVIVVILSSVLLSALSLSASAQSHNIFYLHAGYVLDENAPTGATPDALKLVDGQYYVWKTGPFSAQQSFPSGAWNVTVWMNMTQEPTQYRLKLGVVNSSGVFLEHAHSFTPTITSSSPTRYEVTISVGTTNLAAGESLAVGFLRQWQNGSYSPAAFIFFDSQAMPSSLNGPGVPTTTLTTTQTTTYQTTTTQQTTTTTTEFGSGSGIGFAFALIGIGAGVAAACGGLAVAMTGRGYPEVFPFGGYYYCARHRLPVWYVQGHLWCPVERRYLRS